MPCRRRRQGQQTMLFLKIHGFRVSAPQASKRNTWHKTHLGIPWDDAFDSLSSFADFRIFKLLSYFAYLHCFAFTTCQNRVTLAKIRRGSQSQKNTLLPSLVRGLAFDLAALKTNFDFVLGPPPPGVPGRGLDSDIFLRLSEVLGRFRPGSRG